MLAAVFVNGSPSMYSSTRKGWLGDIRIVESRDIRVLEAREYVSLATKAFGKLSLM
jgi:hypothetical protein